VKKAVNRAALILAMLPVLAMHGDCTHQRVRVMRVMKWGTACVLEDWYG
jgi:hypothetical protein